MVLCHLCSVAGTQFPYTQSSNPTASSHNAGDALRHRQRAVTHPSLRKEATRPAVSGCGQGQGWSRFGGDEGSKGFRKRARVELEVMEDCEEEETEAKQQTPFITARDQYVSNLNCWWCTHTHICWTLVSFPGPSCRVEGESGYKTSWTHMNVQESWGSLAGIWKPVIFTASLVRICIKCKKSYSLHAVCHVWTCLHFTLVSIATVG